MYWVSCRALARSARKAAPPSSSSVAARARAAVVATTGSSAARIRCPSVWPERDEPHAGGDQVSGERLQISAAAPVSSGDAVARGCNADRDRIGDRAVPDLASRSSAAHGHAARVASTKARALRGGFEMTLPRRRKRRSQLGDGAQRRRRRRSSPRDGHARRKTRVAEARAVRDHRRRASGASVRASRDIASLDRPFDAARIGERARPETPATATPSGDRARRQAVPTRPLRLRCTSRPFASAARLRLVPWSCP